MTSEPNEEFQLGVMFAHDPSYMMSNSRGKITPTAPGIGRYSNEQSSSMMSAIASKQKLKESGRRRKSSVSSMRNSSNGSIKLSSKDYDSTFVKSNKPLAAEQGSYKYLPDLPWDAKQKKAARKDPTKNKKRHRRKSTA